METKNVTSSTFGDVIIDYNSTTSGMSSKSNNVFQSDSHNIIVCNSNSNIILSFVSIKEFTDVKIYLADELLLDVQKTDSFLYFDLKFKTVNEATTIDNGFKTIMTDKNGTVTETNYEIVIRKFTQHSDEEFLSLKDDYDTKVNEVTDLNTSISEKDAKIANLNQNITDLNTSISEKDAKIANLNTSISEKDAEIANLNQNITDLNTSISEKDAEIANLNTSISEKDAKIESLMQLMDDTDGDNGNLKNTIEAYEHQIEELNLEIEKLNEKVASLESDLYNANEEKNDLIAENKRLENQISILQEQINNTSGDSRDLAEQLARAKEELNELNNDVLLRIQKIENKLDNTTNISNNNKTEIDKMQSSLMEDIRANLGSPRFGMMPLPIAKQSIAANSELLQDPNTAHLYIKKDGKLISKTVENEDNIFEIKEFIDSSWIGIGLNAYNVGKFLKDDTDFTINSNETFNPINDKIELYKLKFTYDPLLDYIVAVRMLYGEIESVYFEDDFGNNYPCKLVGKSINDYCYKLDTMDISITKLFPVIKFKQDNNVINIKNISIFKDKSSSLSMYSGLNKNGTDGKDGFGGKPVDPSLIDRNTIVNNDGTFTIEKDHDILVKIPLDSLMEGKYTIVLRAGEDTNYSVEVSTVFDGRLWDKQITGFKNKEYSAGGKTTYIDTTVPTFTTDDNYIRIHTETSNAFIIEYFLFKIVDYNEYKYYTRNEIDEKDIIYCGKTSNNGNRYTAACSLIEKVEDGTTVRVKWNADSTDEVYFQINGFGYRPVVNDKQKAQKKMYKDAIYILSYNEEKRNFLLLAKGGDGIPDDGLDISETNFGDMDLYLSTTILQGREVNTHCSVTASKIFIFSESVGFVMSDKYDTGSRNNTDVYKVLQFNPNDGGTISIDAGIDVSNGYYSGTSLYNICNRYAIATSHKYTSGGDNSKSEEIHIFDSSLGTDKSNFFYQHGSFNFNDLCGISPDAEYVYFTANATNYNNYMYIIKVKLSDATGSYLPQINGKIKNFFVTDLAGTIYTTRDDPDNYVTSDGKTLSSSLGISNMVQTRDNDTFIINKSNHIYLAKLGHNGNDLNFNNIIKDFGIIPGGLASPYRTTLFSVVFSNGLNYMQFDMYGNLTSQGTNKYIHRMDHFNNFIYGYKKMGEYNYQITKRPTKIFPKS